MLVFQFFLNSAASAIGIRFGGWKVLGDVGRYPPSKRRGKERGLNLFRLCQQLLDEDATVMFCQNWKLLSSSWTCPGRGSHFYEVSCREEEPSSDQAPVSVQQAWLQTAWGGIRCPYDVALGLRKHTCPFGRVSVWRTVLWPRSNICLSGGTGKLNTKPKLVCIIRSLYNMEIVCKVDDFQQEKNWKGLNWRIDFWPLLL